MKVSHNIDRLNYLIEMYKLSINEFLELISQKLQNALTKEDIFSDEIKVTHLKRIDKVFGKGIHYYLDPSPPIKNKKSSIFFRKNSFGENLNLEAKKVVDKYEKLKLSISATQKIIGLKINRKLSNYTTKDIPKEVAKEVRKQLYPRFNKDKKVFLKSVIEKLSAYNIFVFEYIEHHNKSDKINIDGFFLKPNFIVVKRAKYFSREILTLAHELGHFLLNEEDSYSVNFSNQKLSEVEKWCWNFAHYFLMGNYADEFELLPNSGVSNDYNWAAIKDISTKTHISEKSLFTTLLLNNKISPANYKKVSNEIDAKIIAFEKELKEKRKKEGGKGRAPKAINSPLYETLMRTAYYEGAVSEYDVIKNLNLETSKFEAFIE